MLSWESGCNLVASIASFICIISKQWSFSGSERQFTDTGSQGHTNSIARDVREFPSGQKGHRHRVWGGGGEGGEVYFDGCITC